MQRIYLAVDEKWVMGVVIKPTSAPDYQKAVAVLQSMNITLSATSPAPSAPLLPAAAPTAPPAEEPFQGEASIKSSAMTPVPLTPEPAVLPTPYPEDTLLRDSSNTVSVTVPKGWFALLPPDGILQNEALVTNFNIGAMERHPEDAIGVHFGIEKLKEGQTFAQRLAERRELETNPGYGPPPTYITDPEPITMAGYSGVTFHLGVIMDDGEQPVQWIFLLVDERWIFGIAIYPTSSPDYQKALSIFQTLSITPH